MDGQKVISENSRGTTEPAARGQGPPATGKPAVRTILVQQLLTFLGHDPGPADGVLGPATRAALTDFQRQRGLPVNGALSEEVLACFAGVRLMARVMTPVPADAAAPPGLQKAGTTQARLAAAMDAFQQKDFDSARSLWTDLAGQNNAEAQHRLGMLYDKGYGVTRNPERAAAWYRRAAMQDHAKAQTNLGAMYARGEGVAKDYNTAFDLMQRAASQGLAQAQHNLGMMYAGGNGVRMNYLQAYMWFSLAAAQGNEEARKARNALGALMPLSQIVEAKRLSWEWRAFQTSPSGP